VPTGTDSLPVIAKGTVPITMDISIPNGDPDVLGVSAGDVSFAKLIAPEIAPEIAPGVFFAFPEGTGPFPAGGVALARRCATLPLGPLGVNVSVILPAPPGLIRPRIVGGLLRMRWSIAQHIRRELETAEARIAA
jgi:hypothetical protein